MEDDTVGVRNDGSQMTSLNIYNFLCQARVGILKSVLFWFFSYQFLFCISSLFFPLILFLSTFITPFQTPNFSAYKYFVSCLFIQNT